MIQSGYLVTSNGYTISVDSAASILGTGVDAGHNNALDFTLRLGSGQTTTYDIYVASGGPPLSNAAMMTSSASASGTSGQTGSVDQSLPGTATTSAMPVSGVATSELTDGSYLVIGTGSNDTLSVDAADAAFVGNGGTDEYVFDHSNYSETILNGLVSGSSASSTLEFTTGATDRDLWFDRVDGTGAVSGSGDDLRIDILGTTRSVIIDDWFAPGDTYAQLSQIVLKDGMTLNDLGLNGLMPAMTTFEQGYAASHGGTAFNPGSAANSQITDPGVLAAMKSAWQH
jgi:hypothetical protein